MPQSSIGSMVSVATKAQHHELQSYAAGPPYYDQSFPTYPDYARFQSDLADILTKADGAQAASAPGGTAASSSAAAHPAGAAPTGGVSVLGGGPGTGTAAVVPAALTAPADLRVPAEEQLSPNGTCSVPQ